MGSYNIDLEISISKSTMQQPTTNHVINDAENEKYQIISRSESTEKQDSLK